MPEPITLAIAALGYLAKTAREDYRDIRQLVYSSEYQNMSESDRNGRLGKELAASLAFSLAFSFGSLGNVVYNQYVWRTSGTSDWLRKVIENYI